MNYPNSVIIIVGATAAGKTAFALEAAQVLGTAIISADSRQCFREMNIGVAKPTAEELSTIQHYFVNSHSVHDQVNAAVFEQYALDAVEEIFRDRNVAVMTGGTGLYVKAFCDGLDEIPAVDEGIREQVIEDYRLKGMEWLQAELRQRDPQFWEIGERQNPHRLMRALEVVLSTGRPISSFRSGKSEERPFNIVKIGIDVPRDLLYERINQRVERMMEAGLETEARSLFPLRHLNALQSVGYQELFEYFDGNCSLAQAVNAIKQNTRRYAKRQLTWFKKDTTIQWISPGTEVKSALAQALSR